MKQSLDEINQMMSHSLISNLGIHVTEITDSEIQATMPVDERTCQPFGVLHGGASLSLAETLAGLGSMLLIAEDEYAVGAEVTGNHVSSAPVGMILHANAKIIHKGRSTHLWNVDIFTPDDKLVSTVRVLNSIRKR